ncbi:MAG: FG-GAP repeat protein, partial [Planctomycetota bacterium]
MKLRISVLVVFMIATNVMYVFAQDCTPLIDCNNNSQEDSCDISQGLSSDCDLNGVPDECQMADSVLADCNMNGLLDACEPVQLSDTSGAATAVGTMDGPHLLMTDPGSRSIELYERLGTAWNQKDAIVPSDADANDGFGLSMAISDSLLVVGAPNKSGGRGAAYVFEKQGNSWVQVQILQAANPLEGDVYGFSVSVLGSTIAVGAPQSEA